MGKHAGMRYEEDEGKVRAVIVPPVPEGAPKPATKWVPKLGEDTRDLRDPEKLGKRILARVRRKGKK